VVQPGVDPALYSSLIDDDATDEGGQDFDEMLRDEEEMPIPVVGDTHVDLPGGVMLRSGVVTREAVVRELTGYDEEALARKSYKSTNEYLRALVLRVVDNIGGDPLDELGVDQLLLGDRDALILGTRVATFGDEITMRNLTCPRCEKDFDVDLSVKNDIPVVRLDKPEDRIFEVALSKNRVAKVSLATIGADLATNEYSTVSQQNTALLANCIIEINGKNINMQAKKPEDVVRSLNTRDRQVLLKEIRERQPGPKFDASEIDCPGGCGFTEKVVVDLVALFQV
jgi:hypothetical protein